MTRATLRKRLARLEQTASARSTEMDQAFLAELKDPFRCAELLWPDVTFYDKQQEIIRSVVEDDETFVVAGNMLGKDFVAGFIALWFFLAHQPVRIITTTVRDDHLRVLWGEMNQFLQTSRLPLDTKHGGPLVVHKREIKKIVAGRVCPISYLLGCVSARGEGMAGHHAPHTLVIIDEASGVDDKVYDFCQTWAHRKLIIGNPNPCHNFFYKGVTGGNLPATSDER